MASSAPCTSPAPRTGGTTGISAAFVRYAGPQVHTTGNRLFHAHHPFPLRIDLHA
jgi:hypothetical protein